MVTNGEIRWIIKRGRSLAHAWDHAWWKSYDARHYVAVRCGRSLRQDDAVDAPLDAPRCKRCLRILEKREAVPDA